MVVGGSGNGVHSVTRPFFLSPGERAHAEDGAEAFGQVAAGFDLLGCFVVVHDGDHDFGDVVLGVPHEVQHGLPGGFACAGAGDGEVIGRVGGVEGDGHRVQPALQLRRHVPVVDEAGVAVGVQADGRQVGAVGGVEPVADPEQVIQPARRLPVAAEDDLGVLGQVLAQNFRQHVLFLRLLLEPQPAQGRICLVPDAEHAPAVAAVGEVDV